MSAALTMALRAADRSPILRDDAAEPVYRSLVVLAIASEWHLEPGERSTLLAYVRQLEGGAPA